MTPKNIITVKAVDSLLTKDQLGNACDALPVYPVADDVVIDELGNAADTWPVTTEQQTPLTDTIPVFDVGGPTYIDSLGNFASAVPVIGLNPRQPPVPGPLDYVEEGQDLDNITVEYDLARPVAMLGVAFRHTGPATTLTATHGGEPLTLIDFVVNDTDNIGVATFIGNNLTVEPANLVITPDVGKIGPAVLRVDDSFAIDEVAVGSFDSQQGYGDPPNPSPLIKFEPVSGDGWGVWAFAGASGEKKPVIISRGAGQVQDLFWTRASSGTLKPVPDFSSGGIGWTQNGEWWEHTGASSYLVGDPLPTPIGPPFWWEVELEIEEGARIYVQVATAGGYLNDTYIGPFSGVIRGYRSQNITASKFQMQSIGNARFRNYQYCDDGSTVLGMFGRTASKVANGSGIQFQPGALSRYAGIAMEVHEA